MNERDLIAGKLIEAGRLLHGQGIYTGRAGNMSARLSDGRILVTRSGTHKGLLTGGDLILLIAEGTPLEPGTITSEALLHLAAYAARSDVGAVLHAHPPACTTLAMLGEPLNALISEEGRLALGEVPLLPPAPPGDPAGAERWAVSVRAGGYAALLAQHGVIVVGTDVWDAFVRLETCEQIAELQWRMTIYQRLARDSHRSQD